MIGLQFNTEYISRFVQHDEIKLFESEIELHRHHIYKRTGKGSDFLGWVDLPATTSNDLLGKLEDDASRIRAQSELVVVIGIGGSYLGTRAVTMALENAFGAMAGNQERNAPQFVYAGHHLDPVYMHQLLRLLDHKDYSVIVISKSGTTTEPAIAFRLLKEHLEKKYGKKRANSRIIAITDASRGALKQLATKEGYGSYVIPDDVGGRFSVLSPVGLLPIAAAGYDVRQLISGAAAMENHLKQADDLFENPASLYAVSRNILYRKGYTIELLGSYTPSMFYFIEWWKQLFGESEGKEHKGIFPAGAGFTTDLHSLGQYIQQGLRNLFETVIRVKQPFHDIVIPSDLENLDGLNYLSGKTMQHVNDMAARGTMLAHVEGGVPNLEITIPQLSEEHLGELIYFFEMACAISGYILKVNPFDQPGVEAYKKKMFELLGKRG